MSGFTQKQCYSDKAGIVFKLNLKLSRTLAAVLVNMKVRYF